jgi:hypothetical protein
MPAAAEETGDSSGPQGGAPALPGVYRLAVIGALFVLVPGIGLFAVLEVAGAGTKAAGLVGLFAFVVGLGLFPAYLRRLDRRGGGTR